MSPVFGEIHPVTQSFKDSMEEQFRLRCEEAIINFKDAFNSSKTYQEKQNMLDELEILTENIKKKSIDYVLSPTIVGTSKGRPKKEKRELVGLERAQGSYKEIVSQKKNQEKKKRKLKEEEEGKKKRKLKDEEDEEEKQKDEEHVKKNQKMIEEKGKFIHNRPSFK